MFCGCLVIGNDVAGTKEQFDNGKELTGKDIALRYNTQEQLVQHLIDVSNNSTKYYKPLIMRAQHTVSQLYSIEVHSQQVFDFYIHILNGLNKQH
jgi:glycosyltransferase involved in cell wall biosynthesis